MMEMGSADTLAKLGMKRAATLKGYAKFAREILEHRAIFGLGTEDDLRAPSTLEKIRSSARNKRGGGGSGGAHSAALRKLLLCASLCKEGVEAAPAQAQAEDTRPAKRAREARVASDVFEGVRTIRSPRSVASVVAPRVATAALKLKYSQCHKSVGALVGAFTGKQLADLCGCASAPSLSFSRGAQT